MPLELPVCGDEYNPRDTSKLRRNTFIPWIR
jgi:hypothetical protein